MSKCWLASVTLAALVLIKLIGASDADFDFGDEDTEFFSTYEKAFNDHEFFPTDLSLGSLDLISATPEFAKLRSYVDPSKVDVARSRRQAASSSEDDEEDYEEENSSEDSAEKDDRGDVEDYADRYDRFVSRHFRNRDEQRKKEEDDDTDNGGQYKYRFDFSPSNDYERIKQESQAQNRQLAKDPTNCKAFEKDGMLCNSCRDPATGAKSESCAYATIPQHKKYAYETQHSYNSKDRKPEPEDDEESEEDEGKSDREDEADDGDEEDEIEETTTKASPIRQRTRVENISNLPQQPKVIPTAKPVVHLKPGQDGFNGGGYRYQPVDLRSNKERPQVVTQQQYPGVIHPTYYDFYTHFYPSPYNGLLSRSQKIRQQEPANSDDVYVLSYQDDDQVAKVLADFESRDWSNCKKGNKNELTCYTCTDKNGVLHEECMYVSESRQVASKVLPSRSTTTATTATPTIPEAATKPTKKPRRKKVHSEKKVISPKLKKQVSTSAKLMVQKMEEPSEESVLPTGDGGGRPLVTNKAQERQMVKRTVSFKSHVDDSMAPSSSSSDNERVMHYEHQITHVL